MQNHRHTFPYHAETAAGGSSFGTYWAGNSGDATFYTGAPSTWQAGNPRVGLETRGMNITFKAWKRLA